MADGLNRVMLVGNIGQDPELKILNGGNAVLHLRVATTESYLDKDKGQRQERTEWHSVTVWGKRAEALHKLLTKGSGVWVEGKLQTRSWDDAKGGGKRYATEINATDIGFFGGKPAEKQGGSSYKPKPDSVQEQYAQDANDDVPF